MLVVLCAADDVVCEATELDVVLVVAVDPHAASVSVAATATGTMHKRTLDPGYLVMMGLDWMTGTRWTPV